MSTKNKIKQQIDTVFENADQMNPEELKQSMYTILQLKESERPILVKIPESTYEKLQLLSKDQSKKVGPFLRDLIIKFTENA